MISVSMAPEAAPVPEIRNWIPGDIVAANVQHCTKSCVFCQVGPHSARMYVNRCRISRLTHCMDAFWPGQEIRAAVLDVQSDQLILSGREVLGTWEENVALFKPGETVMGTIRSIESYGIFVELTPNLTGLAELKEGITENESAAVYIKSIIPERMKVKLVIIDSHRERVSLPEIAFSPKESIEHLSYWRYSPPGAVKTVETHFDT